MRKARAYRSDPMQNELVRLLAGRKGHFRLESGHHGDLWLDLDLMLVRPGSLRGFAVELAGRLSAYHVDAVCGPLVGGAFLAQMVASELNVEFSYAERFTSLQAGAGRAVGYRIPNSLRPAVRGKAVAIVDDVINAGSAVRATFADLQARGARPVAIGTLLVLGPACARFAADVKTPLESLARLPNELWKPSECPLCAAGVPLEDITGLPP